jgi:replicative DNA helicase
MRPILSDLRESGAIEQDSDVVLFVHRPEMYYDKDEYKGLAEIIVAKQRNGPLDIVKLAFNAGRSTFSNLSHRTTDGKAAQTGNEDALPF